MLTVQTPRKKSVIVTFSSTASFVSTSTLTFMVPLSIPEIVFWEDFVRSANSPWVRLAASRAIRTFAPSTIRTFFHGFGRTFPYVATAAGQFLTAYAPYWYAERFPGNIFPLRYWADSAFPNSALNHHNFNGLRARDSRDSHAAWSPLTARPAAWPAASLNRSRPFRTSSALLTRRAKTQYHQRVANLCSQMTLGVFTPSGCLRRVFSNSTLAKAHRIAVASRGCGSILAQQQHLGVLRHGRNEKAAPARAA